MKDIINNLNLGNRIKRNEFELVDDQQIDTRLYSRQIYSFGIDTMKKISKLKLLIIGMRGLGIEISKNIILLGPQEIQIYDPEITKINDLGSNFYLTEDDIDKKRRDEASLNKLSELNPYVKVAIMKGSIIENIENFNAVIITEIMRKEKLFEINEICRKKKKAFIYCGVLGLSGFIFNDFGKEHVILNENGEDTKKCLIRKIEKGIIYINNDYPKEDFEFDYATFHDVDLDELNDGKPRKIKKINSVLLVIDEKNNYSNFEGYFKGGYLEEFKMPKKQYHLPLKDFLDSYPDKEINSKVSNKNDTNELLYISILSIHEFYDKYKSLPELNNNIQTKEIINRTKTLFEKYNQSFKKNLGWNINIPYNVASFAKAEITPICAFFGGIVSNEVIKLTGIYIPINQWFILDFFEIVKNLGNNVNRKIYGTRYDEQISIFGNELQKKLENSNIFLVGASSVGCELLKNFALMGVANNKEKEVILADYRNILKSDLNDHFLFRKNNIGYSKSECACNAIKKISPNFNCKFLKEKVCEINNNYFNEKFFKNQNYIISAVNDIKSRQFIDHKCTDYFKCLIYSFTFGIQAITKMVVPYITSCYNEEIPSLGKVYHNNSTLIQGHVCMIPKLMYGFLVSLFDYYFKKVIEYKNEYKEKSSLSERYIKTLSKLYRYYLKLSANQNIDKVIEFSTMIFIKKFEQEIEFVQEEYYSIKPIPIKYNSEDEISFLFVKTFSNILSRVLSIKGDLSDNHIKSVSSKFVELKSNTYNNKKMQDEFFLLDQDFYYYDEEKFYFNPERFDMDQDDHFNLLYSFYCLNARNYKCYIIGRYNFKNLVKQKEKIPSNITLNSTAAGIISLQLYNLYQTNEINLLRDYEINLSNNSIIKKKQKRQLSIKTLIMVNLDYLLNIFLQIGQFGIGL